MFHHFHGLVNMCMYVTFLCNLLNITAFVTYKILRETYQKPIHKVWPSVAPNYPARALKHALWMCGRLFKTRFSADIADRLQIVNLNFNKIV